MANKLAMIFTNEQMNRLVFNGDEILIDLHGMNKKTAFWFLKCIIGLCITPMHLVVIHGYNHGTALKEMIQTVHLSDRITSLSSDRTNMGRTHIYIGG